ncbi:MAG: iron-containing redox enzyme family protein [Bacteriovoracaceae bacterium]
MNWEKMLKESAQSIRMNYPSEHFRNKNHYAWWLSQTYHFVRHSTSLLGLALPYLRDEKLRAVFEHHLGEESRHDLLALKDIENLGHSVFEPSRFTEAFYQSQYYRIQFQGGEALLGYILFLENLAVTWGKEIYDDLNSVYPKSLLFLRVHAEEDVSHVSRAIALVEGLSPEAQRVIEENLSYSHQLYLAMLLEGISQRARKVA